MRRTAVFVATGLLLAAMPVTAVDLTSNGTFGSRYLVNLGQDTGNTVFQNFTAQGLYDIAGSSPPWGVPWWRMNDGITANPDGTATPEGTPDTFGGSNPDYFGYQFKLPATVTRLEFWNRGFADGGTFAAQPRVEYLDALEGTWHEVSATWNPAYDPAYVPNAVRYYDLTLDTPVEHAWGIRLIGDASETPGAGGSPAADDDGTGVPGAGFIGVAELRVHGDVEVGVLNIADNLASVPNGGVPVASRWQVNTAVGIARINDGSTLPVPPDTGNVNTTFGAAAAEDWIGISWAGPKDNVAAIGFVFASFRDGGLLGAENFCPGEGAVDTISVDYTTDPNASTDPAGVSWTPASGLDLGRYPADFDKLQALFYGVDTGFLFRFAPVSGIYGIRLRGNPAGFVAGDQDGFLGCLEFEVFANLAGPIQAPTSPQRRWQSLKGLWDRTVQKLRAAVQDEARR